MYLFAPSEVASALTHILRVLARHFLERSPLGQHPSLVREPLRSPLGMARGPAPGRGSGQSPPQDGQLGWPTGPVSCLQAPLPKMTCFPEGAGWGLLQEASQNLPFPKQCKCYFKSIFLGQQFWEKQAHLQNSLLRLTCSLIGRLGSRRAQETAQVPFLSCSSRT